MTSPIDFEHERALRQGSWTCWTEAVPPADIVIRLRGELNMTGGGAVDPASKFVRRGQALCRVSADGSGMHMVQPAYTHLEWMPG